MSHLSRGFPRATLLTRINVAALAEPRDQARIPWPVVFAKAYALVAAGSPPLRRVYVKLPWPHLYELPQSVASIIVERDWPHDGDSGEKVLFLGRLKAPDTATLPNLATRMLALKSAPIDSIADFRRTLAIARLPLPLRLLLVWLSNAGARGTSALLVAPGRPARTDSFIQVPAAPDLDTGALPDGGREDPKIPSCYAMTGWRRTESGRPVASIRFSTATPMAASVCWAAKPRARSRGPISNL